MANPRRNRPGTSAQDLWNWTPQDFSKMQGPFAVQEYLQELIRSDPSNIGKIIKTPDNVDEVVWQYEHIRQFILELNLLVVQLHGVCTRESCPKMKATDEWLYLCASHKQPQECSAMDYMIHSLDNSTAIIQDPKIFSSRVSINQKAQKYLNSIVRRLYRLFTHTFFHHRDIFQEFESEMHLCGRFTEFSRQFKMMSADLYIIPDDELKAITK